VTGNRSFFRRFVTFFWRLAVLLYSLLLIAVLVVIPVAIYVAINHGTTAVVPRQAALVVAPTGNLVEQSSGVDNLLGVVTQQSGDEAVVRNLVTSIDRARHDQRIKQLFLRLDQLGGATPGQLQDLVAAIDRFKQSGKPVVAWSSSYDMAQYELASHADTIYLDPFGYVFLPGYGVFRNYYKDALDKLGITVNVFRVGKYKSYVEPYTRNDMSPAARADALAWLNSLWGTYRGVVSADRQLTPDAISEYIKGFPDALVANGGNAAALAKKSGLVDRVAPLESVRQDMIKQVGEDAGTHSFNQISDADYLAATGGPMGKNPSDSRIAVVTVEGDIVDGESVPGSAGGDTIARLISEARRDDHVAAMVLRVNSPGGSVTAAERIRRQVVAFRKAGKPVVVSMAGMAASGGYWISMNANQIWAEPSTITGSIGIFGIVPTFDKPLNKLGIHTDGVGTTPLSGALRLDEPLSEPVKLMLQAGVEHGYQAFIGHVAQARGMQVDAVNKIAQGRVWSGVDAQRIGLVDKLGDVTQAEAAAAKLAGLSDGDYSLQNMQPPSDWRGALQHFLLSHVSAALVPSWLASAGLNSDAVDFLRGLSDPHGLYAKCFCRISGRDTMSGAASARAALLEGD
jgi:protease-4